MICTSIDVYFQEVEEMEAQWQVEKAELVDTIKKLNERQSLAFDMANSKGTSDDVTCSPAGNIFNISFSISQL